jgi:hypothetical protein
MCVVHAGIRVNGPPPPRKAFRARVAGLLAEGPPAGEPSGRLALAVACRPLAPGVFAGQVLTAERDAMSRIERVGATGELLASLDSGPRWAERRRVDFEGGSCEHERLDPPLDVDRALWAAPEDRARQLLRDWVWFAGDSPEETAVEHRRYADAGREVRGASLRSARLHERPRGGGLVHDGLGPELRWLREVLRERWAQSGEGS